MIRTPHSLTVYHAEALIAGSAVVGTERTEGQAFLGQVTPMSAKESFEKWGLEIARPHLLLTPLANRGLFKEGDHLGFDGREFIVKAVMVWNALPGADCVQAALEEI